jgi:hypothetical protein
MSRTGSVHAIAGEEAQHSTCTSICKTSRTTNLAAQLAVMVSMVGVQNSSF